MTVGDLICLSLYPSVVRWWADLLSTGYWLFSMSELICILVRLRQGQFCCQISCVSKHTPLYSVSCLQCSFSTQGVQIEIQIMALFSNQRYKSRPKALVPTYSQVVSVKSSVRLSNLKYYTSLWSTKGIRTAFSSIFAFGGYGWSWKGPRFCLSSTQSS